VHPGHDIGEIAEQTGFSVTPTDVRETERPSAAELAALTEVDPDSLRELELRATRDAAAARLARAHA
jgi:hypothetical protein